MSFNFNELQSRSDIRSRNEINSAMLDDGWYTGKVYYAELKKPQKGTNEYFYFRFSTMVKGVNKKVSLTLSLGGKYENSTVGKVQYLAEHMGAAAPDVASDRYITKAGKPRVNAKELFLEDLIESIQAIAGKEGTEVKLKIQAPSEDQVTAHGSNAYYTLKEAHAC